MRADKLRELTPASKAQSDRDISLESDASVKNQYVFTVVRDF